MSDQKGDFKTDIPADILADALRSAEEREREAAARRRAEESGQTIVIDEGEHDAEPADANSDLTKLGALLDESMARAAQTQKRLEETHERFIRVSADFENFRKRAAREREETIRLGNERLLKDLLPIIDNLERAIASSGSDVEGLRTGVQMVHKLFLDTLGRYGVTAFSAIGEPFDPARHEALMQQESADVAPGTVLSELVKGYFLNERLVRPAAVVVAKAPEETEPVESPSESEESV